MGLLGFVVAGLATGWERVWERWVICQMFWFSRYKVRSVSGMVKGRGLSETFLGGLASDGSFSAGVFSQSFLGSSLRGLDLGSLVTFFVFVRGLLGGTSTRSIFFFLFLGGFFLVGVIFEACSPLFLFICSTL